VVPGPPRAERVLVAVWPDWPVVAAGQPPELPAAVVEANRVRAATPAARLAGVWPGLRRREAQQRCPGLVVLKGDALRDARSWEPVVAAVEGLAVGVEVSGAGRLCLAARGPSRYFGGDASAAGRVKAAAEAAAGQPGCRVGVADGRLAATLAALSAPEPVVVPPGGSRDWLAPWPVSALGAGFEELAGLLVRLGVRTLGDLAALPGPSVLARFGPCGEEARRLARGEDRLARRPRRPPPDFACSASFDPPEERIDAAAFVAKALAGEMLARLAGSGLAAGAVSIEALTERGEILSRRWRLEGDLGAAALAERARWQLEGWGRRNGGLVELRLAPEEVGPDRGRQLVLWGRSPQDGRARRAIARVQGLLGPEAVAAAVLTGGRSPADRARLVPWGSSPGSDPAAEAPWPGRVPRPSPALVHRSPLPATLLDSAGKLLAISGRGVLSAPPAVLSTGDTPGRRVAAWAGPWPLEERWWDAAGRRRARLQILLEGGEAHLVYCESGSWWMEASYA
jgi:protein ImuB